MEENGGVLRYSANTTASTKGPKAAVVNMTGYWGNKTKTIAKMKEYIEEAGKKGVDILVFPETVFTAVTGSVLSEVWSIYAGLYS